MSHRTSAGHPRTWGFAILLATMVWSIAGRAVVEPNGLDFSGDGISDYVTINSDGSRWWIMDASTSTLSTVLWGTVGDVYVPADYDGDAKTDFAVWRPGPAGAAGFWILPSSTGVGYFEPFGQTGDISEVVGDYDGDGKTDVAIYRRAASAGAASYWIYKRSVDGAVVWVNWGTDTDFPIPGDYDGDGKYDFVVKRSTLLESPQLWFLNRTTAGVAVTYFGKKGDGAFPGDYDGDGKTDLAVIERLFQLRQPAGHPMGPYNWRIMRSSDGVTTVQTWGHNNNDLPAPADYDGDGKTDIAVYRRSSEPWRGFVVLPSNGTEWFARKMMISIEDRPIGFNFSYF